MSVETIVNPLPWPGATPPTPPEASEATEAPEIPEAVHEAAPEATIEALEPEVVPAAPSLKVEEAETGPLPPLDGGLAVLDELLRHRSRLLRRIEAGEDLLTIARAMLLTIIVCTAAVGAAVGFYRGGIQIFYASVKLPVVLLMTAALCAPVFTTLKMSLQHKVSLVADFALILCSLGLACLVAVSLSPFLLLAALRDTGYHTFVLMCVSLCAVGGVAGYVYFFRGMHRQLKRGYRLVTITLLFVMALVSTQFTWIARPYVVRPASVEVPFVRAFEGSFLDAVQQSFDSARGIYRRGNLK